MFFLTELPVDCGPPQSIANASVNYTSTAESSVAVYECDEGFFQSGQFVTRCLRNGEPPDPSVVKCGSEPCEFRNYYCVIQVQFMYQRLCHLL